MKKKTINKIQKGFGRDPTIITLQVKLPTEAWVKMSKQKKSKGYANWVDYLVGELLEAEVNIGELEE